MANKHLMCHCSTDFQQCFSIRCLQRLEKPAEPHLISNTGLQVPDTLLLRMQIRMVFSHHGIPFAKRIPPVNADSFGHGY